jgi:KaiC/GvpD/RAD55 family RecA-like ATPase
MSTIQSPVAQALEDPGDDGDYDLAELSPSAREILNYASVAVSRAKSHTEITQAVYFVSVVLMQFDLHPDRDIVVAHLTAKARGLFGVTRNDIQGAVARAVQDVADSRSAAELDRITKQKDITPTAVTARLKPIDLLEFLALDLKPREMLLDPIIPQKGLAMLYAARGTGKTHVGLGIARAVSTGTAFLRWVAPKPRRVLLVDGEMPAIDLRAHFEGLVWSSGGGIEPGMLGIVCGDLIEDGGVGNLAHPKIQEELDRHLEGIDLLVLDNLSSLAVIMRDNDADSWNAMQTWLLRLRRRGVSVLIIHHAGKAGDQRGTSRREDVLDTSISLRRPADYKAMDGARFEIHIEKGRGIHGDHAKPFEAKLTTLNGLHVWTMTDVEDPKMAEVRRMLEEGATQREIERITGIPKSTIARWKLKFDAEQTNTGNS